MAVTPMQQTTTIAQPHPITTLRTQRVLPFAREQVYAAFAESDALERWWGPAGFSNTFDLFEFTAGGRWIFTMHGPNGTDYRNESVFEALDAPSRVVIRHLSRPHYTLSVSLEPHVDGTTVEWAQEFADPRIAAGFRSIAGPANEENLDRLTAVLAEALTAATADAASIG